MSVRVAFLIAPIPKEQEGGGCRSPLEAGKGLPLRLKDEDHRVKWIYFQPLLMIKLETSRNISFLMKALFEAKKLLRTSSRH